MQVLDVTSGVTRRFHLDSAGRLIVDLTADATAAHWIAMSAIAKAQLTSREALLVQR